MNNGDGLRVVLWLSGCHHKCKGCQNPQTWDINSGIKFNIESEKELFKELRKDYISGITFTGGDPLHDNNCNEVLSLIKKIKILFPQKTIWLYTGYKWEYIMDRAVFNKYDFMRYEIISLCDVVLDGLYIEKLRDVSLKWVGSSNQRVIDVQSTLKHKTIIIKT